MFRLPHLPTIPAALPSRMIRVVAALIALAFPTLSARAELTARDLRPFNEAQARHRLLVGVAPQCVVYRLIQETPDVLDVDVYTVGGRGCRQSPEVASRLRALRYDKQRRVVMVEDLATGEWQVLR